MKKAILISITALVLLTNLPPVNWFLTENFSYCNFDGSFKTQESGGKGNTFLTCVRQYGYFLCQHPEKDIADNNLYRTFTIKPWCFWQWKEYIFYSERFRLPYKDPAKIRRN